MNGLMKPCTTGWCSITQQSIYPPIQGRLVEPEVVATSPYPIKSRVPVCCGFSSVKMVLAVPMHRDTGDALDVVSLLLDYASMDPPAGAAPAGFLYKREPSPMHRDVEAKVEFQLAVKREASKDRATASPNNDGCDVA